MLVLGIDPGTQTTGYGLLKLNGKKIPELVTFNWIKTEDKGIPEQRLREIYIKIKKVLKEHKPDAMAMERVFFFSNAKTVIRVSQAQGVFLLAAAQANIPVFEYTPGQVKKEIAGNGRADKTLMKQTVRNIFGIRAPNKKKTHFDDVCDALAIALTHFKLEHGIIHPGLILYQNPRKPGA